MIIIYIYHFLNLNVALKYFVSSLSVRREIFICFFFFNKKYSPSERVHVKVYPIRYQVSHYLHELNYQTYWHSLPFSFPFFFFFLFQQTNIQWISNHLAYKYFKFSRFALFFLPLLHSCVNATCTTHISSFFWYFFFFEEEKKMNIIHGIKCGSGEKTQEGYWIAVLVIGEEKRKKSTREMKKLQRRLAVVQVTSSDRPHLPHHLDTIASREQLQLLQSRHREKRFTHSVSESVSQLVVAHSTTCFQLLRFALASPVLTVTWKKKKIKNISTLFQLVYFTVSCTLQSSALLSFKFNVKEKRVSPLALLLLSIFLPLLFHLFVIHCVHLSAHTSCWISFLSLLFLSAYNFPSFVITGDV